MSICKDVFSYVSDFCLNVQYLSVPSSKFAHQKVLVETFRLVFVIIHLVYRQFYDLVFRRYLTRHTYFSNIDFVG